MRESEFLIRPGQFPTATSCEYDNEEVEEKSVMCHAS